MRAGPDDAPEGRLRSGKGARAPERRCVLTGAHGPRQQLIRLVAGPDGAVWPDLPGRLPGRGAWVVADGGILAEAVASGRLAKALARAFRSPPPSVPADLPERIRGLLEQRALDRMGLEHRGGRLAFGSERLEGLARSGRLHLLAHAADAREDGCRALDQAFRVGGGDPEAILSLPFGRDSLSKALGRANVVHLGAVDGGAAARIASDIVRLRSFALLNHASAEAKASRPDGAEARAGERADAASCADETGHAAPQGQERTGAE
jgi:predicted RNA-binding protein YlxR (DUF448 family)